MSTVVITEKQYKLLSACRRIQLVNSRPRLVVSITWIIRVIYIKTRTDIYILKSTMYMLIS